MQIIIFMSQRKIIFLIIVGIVLTALVAGLLLLTNQKPKTTNSGSLSIWINEGTTEDFQKLIDGFYAYSPANKNIKITAHKEASTTVAGYNTRLLQTIANGEGPDIFMVPHGEYSPLESRIAEIPSSVLSVTDFENRFDTVFSDLIINAKSSDGKSTEQSLRGIPLGYETLGVFYNRSLFRTGTPTTWTAVENLYGNFPANIFPTNLGLKRSLVPNIADILPIFFLDANVTSYKNLANVTAPFREYYSYGDLGNTAEDGEVDMYATNNTLRAAESQIRLDRNATTLDAFMRGNIGMIIGYPSLIQELALSQKRVGATDSMTDLIYTARIPQISQQSASNIAKYNYFAISKNTENPDAAAQFLAYLMTPEAQQIAMQTFPYRIPAQREFQIAAQNNVLSPNFSKAKLDAFIPAAGMSLFTFDYGAKTTFEALLDAHWDDFADNSTLSTLGETISSTIACEVADNPELCK